MARVDLQDVTLVAIDDVAHELTRMALQECLDRAAFGDVLVLTDQPEKIRLHGARYSTFESDGSVVGVERAFWYTATPLVETPWMLWAQWDSWILNPECWDDAFFGYDYIGAPWWYVDDPEHNVGNGGFSLRSTRLMNFLNENREEFPFQRYEDDTIWRKYGDRLKALGFTVAPMDIACRFSFEHVQGKLPMARSYRHSASTACSTGQSS